MKVCSLRNFSADGTRDVSLLFQVLSRASLYELSLRLNSVEIVSVRRDVHNPVKFRFQPRALPGPIIHLDATLQKTRWRGHPRSVHFTLEISVAGAKVFTWQPIDERINHSLF
jgi:hypothetical protein